VSLCVMSEAKDAQCDYRNTENHKTGLVEELTKKLVLSLKIPDYLKKAAA
jgi:hypothetical protein